MLKKQTYQILKILLEFLARGCFKVQSAKLKVQSSKSKKSPFIIHNSPFTIHHYHLSFDNPLYIFYIYIVIQFMPSRRILKIKVPFVDTAQSKPRPVLELSSPSDEHNNFQVAYITSKKPKKNYLSDILLDSNHPDFEMTGLLKTSYIRLSKIFTIDTTMVDFVIGDLPADLNQILNQALTTHFKL